MYFITTLAYVEIFNFVLSFVFVLLFLCVYDDYVLLFNSERIVY